MGAAGDRIRVWGKLGIVERKFGISEKREELEREEKRREETEREASERESSGQTAAGDLFMDRIGKGNRHQTPERR